MDNRNNFFNPADGVIGQAQRIVNQRRAAPAPNPAEQRVGEMVLVAYNKNLALAADDNRSLLKTLLQHNFWRKMQDVYNAEGVPGLDERLYPGNN